MEKYSSQQYMDIEHKYGAHNYHPLEVVICKAEGIWVEDPEGKRYIDMLSPTPPSTRATATRRSSRR